MYSDNQSIPDIMTVKETAKWLKIGTNTLYGILRHGALKSIRIGRQYRIPRQAIIEYVALDTTYSQ